MRKPGIKTTRIIVWSLAGSILASSCTCDDIFIIEKIIDTKDSHDSCAIRILMTKEKIAYLNELAELSSKIISDRDFAKSVVNNPKRYMRGRSARAAGINMDRDDALMKIISALADDEIADAINSNDVKKYLCLMNRKGYLEETAKMNDYSQLLTVEQKRELLQRIGFHQISDRDVEVSAIAAIVFVFYAAVIAVSWVGAAYTVAAAVNMAAAATVVMYAGAAVKTKVTTSSMAEKYQLSSNFDVYLLGASDENLEITFSDKNINKVVSDAVDAYSEIFIEDARKLNLEKFKQTINLNLSKQRGMRNKVLMLDKKENGEGKI